MQYKSTHFLLGVAFNKSSMATLDFTKITGEELDAYYAANANVRVAAESLTKFVKALHVAAPVSAFKAWWSEIAPGLQVNASNCRELSSFVCALVLKFPEFVPPPFEGQALHTLIREQFVPRVAESLPYAETEGVEQRMSQLESRLKQVCDFLKESDSEASDDNAGCKACGQVNPANARFCMHCGTSGTKAPAHSAHAVSSLSANGAANASSLSAHGASKSADYVSCGNAMREINEALSTSQSGSKFKPHLGAKHLVQFPEHWPALVQNDAVDNGLSMASLISKLQAECTTQSSSANHHGEVLLDLIPLILRNDKVGALTLCSDRLQFLRKMGKGKPLPYCDAFYSELRGEDEQNQRVKSADLKAKWLTPAAKAKQHVYDQLSQQAGTHASPGTTTGQATHDSAADDTGAFKGGKRRGRKKRH